MNKQQLNKSLNKSLNKIQDCINEIRLGWQIDMNIEVLVAEADELLRKYEGDKNNG